MKKIILIISSLILLVSTISFIDFSKPKKVTSTSEVSQKKPLTRIPTQNFIHENGNTVKTRFEVPDGFTRIESTQNSWGSHLQNLPLKPHGSKVKLYNGELKYNTSAYMAVVDLPIGKRDLQQCADAVMRLRADYLFSQKKYSDIEFLFVNGNRANYVTYLKGKTPNQTNLWSYLEYVFSYASTLSLNKQLKQKDINKLDIGDVFIKGGSPGHAVIVVDKCVGPEGEVRFMLAQSYMPAQEIQILVNPIDPNTPWYESNFGEILMTAEYSFTKNQLKSF
jgi:hypothetical protein